MCRDNLTVGAATVLAPTYDQAGGEACLAGLAPASTQADFCHNNVLRAQVCEVAFGVAGTKTPGQACVSTAECAATAYCDPVQLSCKPRLPLYAPCSGTPNECLKGTFCEADGGICKFQLPLGVDCTANYHCLSNICGPNNRCVDPPDTLSVSVLCGGG